MGNKKSIKCDGAIDVAKAAENILAVERRRNREIANYILLDKWEDAKLFAEMNPSPVRLFQEWYDTQNFRTIDIETQNIGKLCRYSTGGEDIYDGYIGGWRSIPKLYEVFPMHPDREMLIVIPEHIHELSPVPFSEREVGRRCKFRVGEFSTIIQDGIIVDQLLKKNLYIIETQEDSIDDVTEVSPWDVIEIYGPKQNSETSDESIGEN